MCAWTSGDTYLTFVVSENDMPYQDGSFEYEIFTNIFVLESEQSDEVQAGIGFEFGHLYNSYEG